MSAQSIRVLKNRHQGDTIFVVASGASLNHIDPRFFERTISVGINDIWQRVHTTYTLMHHHETAQQAIDAGVRLVTSDRDWGGPGWGQPATMTGDYYSYRTHENTRDTTPRIDEHALTLETTDTLVVSPCTTSEALQFAAHLTGPTGTVICCGIDGAALDGRWNFSNYNIDHTGQSAGTNPQHVRLTQPIIRQTIAAIRKKGVRVYSLSPFVGYDHEGHIYTPAPELSGRALLDALKTTNYTSAVPA